MSAEEWQIVWFTAWVSALSTLAILPFGLGIAWLLARYHWPGKSIVETLIALPLVMPPVATGLILLKLLGRRGPIGDFLHNHFGFDVVFTWRGVLIALSIMSFPLFVRSTRVAFEEINPRLEQMARTLARPTSACFAPLLCRWPRAGLRVACCWHLPARWANSAPRSWLPVISRDAPQRFPSPFFNPCSWARTPTPFVCWECRWSSRLRPCGAANG